MAFVDRFKEENGKRYIYASTSNKPGDWYVERVYKNFVETLKSDVLDLDSAFGKYLDKLETVITDGVKTMATGKGYLFINPAFVSELVEIGNNSGLGINVPMFVIVHEVFHNVYNHMDEGRLYASKFPSHKYQNMAMDYEINILIESLFPQFKGCTEIIPGLIKDEYLGQMWTEIYPDMQSDPMRLDFGGLENQLEQQKNAQKTDDNEETEEQGQAGGGGEISQDYLDGRRDAATVLRGILGRILNGKNSTPAELQQALDEIKNYAEIKGISINESNNPADEVSTWTEGYNDGFVSKVGEVYADIYRKLHGIEPPQSNKNSLNPINDDDLRDITGADAPEGKGNNQNNNDDVNGSDGDDSSNGESGLDAPENDVDDFSDDENQGGGYSNGEFDSYNDGEGDSDGDSEGDGSNGSNGLAGGNSEGYDDVDSQSGEGQGEDNDGNPGSGSHSIRLGGDVAFNEEDNSRLSEILDGQDKEEKDGVDNTTEETAEDVKKIIDNQLENGNIKDENVRRKLGELSERMGEVVERRSNDSNINWQEILEKFVSKRVKVRTHKYDTAGRRFGDRRIIRHVSSRRKIEDGLKHIVFSIDTSGSVVAVCLSFLMNEVCDILENHIEDGCVVDVIKHDEEVHSCIRFVHESGNLEEEIGKINVLEDTGGTDYREVMEMIDNLFNGMPTGYSEFDDSDIEAGRADCAIMVTDSDFYSGGKYYDIDDKKVRILIYEGNNRRLKGEDRKFIDSIINVHRTVNESVVNEDINLDDFDYDENDNPEVVVKQDEKDVFMKKNLGNVVNNILRENGIDYLNCVFEDGKLVLEGSPIIDNGFIDELGDTMKHIDLIRGDVKIFDLSESMFSMIPRAITGSVIMCNCNVSDETLDRVKAEYKNSKFYYVNCGNEGTSNMPSFNAACAIDYYLKNEHLKETMVIDDVEALLKGNRYVSLVKEGRVKLDVDGGEKKGLRDLMMSNLFVDKDVVDVFVTISSANGRKPIKLNPAEFNTEEYTTDYAFPPFFKIRLSHSNIMITGSPLRLHSLNGLPLEMDRNCNLQFTVRGSDSKTREIANEYRTAHDKDHANGLARFSVYAF